MCGYGNRVPEGWHHISDRKLLKPPAWEPARPFIPDYEGKEADQKMLAEIAAKPDPEPDRPAEMYGSY